MGVYDRRRRGDAEDGDDDVFTFASKPVPPGERTPDIFVKFQVTSAESSNVKHQFFRVCSTTRLSQVRRTIIKHFSSHFDKGFIFLSSKREVLKARERELTVFDILPKLPLGKPSPAFQYPCVHYKEVAFNYDGKRYKVMCACVVFLFEQSSVSHWSREKLDMELSACSLQGFSFIPGDITSWTGELVEMRATMLHVHAALGKNAEVKTDLEQIWTEKYIPELLQDHRKAMPLHYAAANGHQDTCEFLLTSLGRDFLHHKDINGKTPLHLALYRRKYDVAAYLLQLGPDMEHCDIYGNSCKKLLQLVKPSVTESMLKTLEIECLSEDTVTHLALEMLRVGNKEQSRRLSRLLRAPDLVLELGRTPLHLAAALGDQETVGNLLANGFTKMARDTTAYLPFHHACKMGNAHLLASLIASDMKDNDINTGFRLAMREKKYGVLRTILELRPGTKIEEDVIFLVMDALNSNFVSCWKDLLPVVAVDRDLLSTYLLEISREGHRDAVALLIELGARLDLQDLMGRTALHESAQMGRTDVLELLLKNGANPNVKDWRFSTPLHYACASGMKKCVKMLLNDEAVHAGLQDCCGRTPLMLAAYHKRDSVLKLLLQGDLARLHPHSEDVHGYSILHYTVNMKLRTAETLLAKIKEIQLSSLTRQSTDVRPARDAYQKIAKVWRSRYRLRRDITQDYNWDSPPDKRSKQWSHKKNTPFKYQKKTVYWTERKAAKDRPINSRPGQNPFECMAIMASDYYTPLHVATLKGSVPLVQHMLKKTSDAVTRDRVRRWPIAIAVRKSSPPLVSAILNGMKENGQLCPVQECFTKDMWLTETKTHLQTLDTVFAHSNTALKEVGETEREWLRAAAVNNKPRLLAKLIDHGVNTVKALCSAIKDVHNSNILKIVFEQLTRKQTVDDVVQHMRTTINDIKSISMHQLALGLEYDSSYFALSHYHIQCLKFMSKYFPTAFRDDFDILWKLMLSVPEHKGIEKEMVELLKNIVNSQQNLDLVTYALDQAEEKHEKCPKQVHGACLAITKAAELRLWKVLDVLLMKAAPTYWNCIISTERCVIEHPNGRHQWTADEVLRRMRGRDPAPTATINSFLQQGKQSLGLLSGSGRNAFNQSIRDSLDKNVLDELNSVFPLIIRASEDWRSELQNACRIGDSGLVEKLCADVSPADFTEKCVNGVSPMDVAAAFGNSGVMRLLLQKGAVPDSATLIACCTGTSFKDIGKWFRKTSTSTTDADDERLKILKMILEAKASDVSINCEHGKPLLTAIQHQRWTLIQHMLRNWVDIKYIFKTENSTTTHQFYQQAPEDIILTIAPYVKEKLSRIPVACLPALCFGAVDRPAETVLLKILSDVNDSLDQDKLYAVLQEPDKHGHTLLHRLSQKGWMESFKIILTDLNHTDGHKGVTGRKVALLNTMDKSGATALWYSLTRQHWTLAKYQLLNDAMLGNRPVPGLFGGKKIQQTVPEGDTDVHKTLSGFANRKCFILRNTSCEVAACVTPSFKSFENDVRSRESEERALKKTVRFEDTEDHGSQNVGYRSLLNLCRLSSIAKQKRCSLLHVACSIGDLETVKQIIKVNPLSLDALDGSGKGALVHGVCSRRKDLVKLLLDTTKQAHETLAVSVEELLADLFACRSDKRHLREYIQFLANHVVHADEGTRSRLSYSTFVKRILHSEHDTTRSQDVILKALILHFSYSNPPCCKFSIRKVEEQRKVKSLVEVLMILLGKMDMSKISEKLLLMLVSVRDPSVHQWLVHAVLKPDIRSRYLTTPGLEKLTPVDVTAVALIAGQSDNHATVTLEKLIEQLTAADGMYQFHDTVIQFAAEKRMWKLPCYSLRRYMETANSINEFWWKILGVAAESGNVAIFKELEKATVTSNMENDMYRKLKVCLQKAALTGSREVVQYLIDRSINPLESVHNEAFSHSVLGKDFNMSWTALHYAAKGGNATCVQCIGRGIREHNCPVSMEIIVQCLHINAKSGSISSYDLLMEISKENGLGMMTGVERQSFFFTAAKHGHEKLAMKILAAGEIDVSFSKDAQPNILHFAGVFGMTMLAREVMHRDPKLALLGDKHKITPIEYAWKNGNTETLDEMIAGLSEEQILLLIGDIEPDQFLFGFFSHALKIHASVPMDSTNVDIRRDLPAGRRFDLEKRLQCSDDSVVAFGLQASRLHSLAIFKDKIFSSRLLALSAMNGCVQTLSNILNGCEKLGITDYMLRKETRDMIPAALAVKNKQKAILKILIDYKGFTDWKQPGTGENLLHMAVKTGDSDVVDIVLNCGQENLTHEKDRGGLTPIAAAAALGLHDILRMLVKGKSVSIQEHVHHSGENSDFTCVECLLDHCIGWSKLSLENVIFSDETIRQLESLSAERGVAPGIAFSTGPLRRFKSQHNLRFIVHLTVGPGRFDHRIIQSALYAMGSNGNGNEANMLLLLHQHGTFAKSLKHCAADGNESLSVFMATKYLTSATNDENERLTPAECTAILSAAAVSGRTTLLGALLNSDRYFARDTALSERAYAFGALKAGLFLDKDLSENGLTPSYSILSDMSEVVPPKVLWSTGLACIGDETWKASLGDPDSRLSLADVSLTLSLPSDTIGPIERRAIVPGIVPDSYKDKKVLINTESFKKNAAMVDFGSDVLLRCFLASQHIYGRVCGLLESSDHRFSHASLVQVMCLSDAYGVPPRTTMEVDGSLTDTVSVKMVDRVRTVQHDNTLERRLMELTHRSRVQNEVIPKLEDKLSRILYGRKIGIRIDWRSVDGRRNSEVYETLMRTLSGDEFGNALGGLSDIISECEEMLNFIETNYDIQTGKHFAANLGGLTEIIVRYVEHLPDTSTPSLPTGELASVWHFTVFNGELRFARASLPLWVAIKLYQSICSNILVPVATITCRQKCSSCSLGSHEVGNMRPVYDRSSVRPQVLGKDVSSRAVTLELDVRSLNKFQDVELVKSIFRDVAQELAYFASTLHAMYRFSADISKVAVSVSATRKRSSVAIVDQTASFEFAAQVTQNKWNLDKQDYKSFLSELESRFLIQKFPKTLMHDASEKAKATIERVKDSTGFPCSIAVDDSRIAVTCLQHCVLDSCLDHPYKVIHDSSIEAVEKLESTLMDSIAWFIDRPWHCNFWTSMNIPNGVWYVPNQKALRRENFTGTALVQSNRRCGVVDPSYIPDPDPRVGIRATAYSYKRRWGRYVSYRRIPKRDRVVPSNKPDVRVGFNFSNTSYELSLMEGRAALQELPEDVCGIWFHKPLHMLTSGAAMVKEDRIQLLSCNNKLYRIPDVEALLKFLKTFANKKVIGPTALQNAYMLHGPMVEPDGAGFLVRDETVCTSDESCMRIFQFPMHCHSRCMNANIVVKWKSFHEMKANETSENHHLAIRSLDATLLEFERKWRLHTIEACHGQRLHAEIIKQEMSQIMTIFFAGSGEERTESVKAIFGSEFRENVDIFFEPGQEICIRFNQCNESDTFVKTLEAAVVHLIKVKLVAAFPANHKPLEEGEISNEAHACKDNSSQNRSEKMSTHHLDLEQVVSILPVVKRFLGAFKPTQQIAEVELLHSETNTHADLKKNKLRLRVAKNEKSFSQIGKAVQGCILGPKQFTADPPRDDFECAVLHPGIYYQHAGVVSLALEIFCHSDSHCRDKLLQKDQYALCIEGNNVATDERISIAKMDDNVYQISCTVDEETMKTGPVKLEIFVCGKLVGQCLPEAVESKDKLFDLVEHTSRASISMKKQGYFLFHVQHDMACDIPSNEHKLSKAGRLTETVDVDFHLLYKRLPTRSVNPQVPFKISNKGLAGRRQSPCKGFETRIFKYECKDAHRIVHFIASCRRCGLCLRVWTPFACIQPGQVVIINQKKAR